MKLPLFQITVVRPDKKVEAPPAKPQKPPVVDFGPYEKVIVFDAGPEAGKGVTWITMMPRRVLMEHLDIEARRLKQPIHFRRLLGCLFGAGGGLVLGAFLYVILMIGQVVHTNFLYILLPCIFGGMLLGAFLPGWWLGEAIFKAPPLWFVRKQGQTVSPVLHKTFDKERFIGHMRWIKETDGSIRLQLPPGIATQSATFFYHGIRSKDLIDMWRTVTSRMQKLRTGALLVIAVCALIGVFVITYTQLSRPEGSQTTNSTPSATVRPGGTPSGR